jgi:hypothetical protein
MTKPALDLDTLPEDPLARRRVLEERSRPNIAKPKLPANREARLAAIEEQSAQCYAEAEELSYRLRRAAKRINNYVPRLNVPGLPARADSEG